MVRRILITRPEPGASATASQLAAKGFEAIVLPLTRIVATGAALPGGGFDAIMATSANALRMLAAEISDALYSTPLYAVGETTASAARERGFRDVCTGRGSGAALASKVVDDLGRGRRILYLTGRVRTASAERELEKAGLIVALAEVYDTVAIDVPEERVIEVLGGKAVDAALVYSVTGARILGEVAGRAVPGDPFAATSFLCLSERIAAGLPETLRARARVAAVPSEEALMALF